MTLAEWLRGYALLQFCCEKHLALIDIANGLSYLDVEAFLALAVHAGMAHALCNQFIKQVTFQRNSRDIFDAPLILTQDNRYIILSGVYKHCGLHEALTSRINSLLLRVNRKGTLFEGQVHGIFEECGAVPKRLQYRNSEGNFECDAAVLWGEYLFLAECKAYSLPTPSASDLFFFAVKQKDAAAQISRIANHLTQDPSILEKSFGVFPNPPKTMVRQKKSWVDSGSGSLPSEW